MSLPVLGSAKYVLENSRRTITQIELQKLLYLAQMTHLGEYDRPALAARFEAWKFGPASRMLHKELKRFGADPIPSTAIPSNLDVLEGTEKTILDRTIRELSGRPASELIGITHWKEGAWAQTYDPRDWSIEIPETLMRQEYLDRLELATHASASHG